MKWEQGSRQYRICRHFYSNCNYDHYEYYYRYFLLNCTIDWIKASMCGAVVRLVTTVTIASVWVLVDMQSRTTMACASDRQGIYALSHACKYNYVNQTTQCTYSQTFSVRAIYAILLMQQIYIYNYVYKYIIQKSYYTTKFVFV